MASIHEGQEQRFAAVAATVEPGRLQFTPPGSRTFVIFVAGATRAAPGSVQDVMVTVDDVCAGTA
ncbi:MAG: hypothetical protein ABSH51_14675 [Solirubrobacteraceae bacterium]|jgi:hypothetical protein